MDFHTVDLKGPLISHHVSGLLKNRHNKLELVLLFGRGREDNNALDLDSKTWRVLKDVPNYGLVSSAYVCTGPSTIYIFGGYDALSDSCSNSIFEYCHRTELLKELYVVGDLIPPALSGSAQVHYMGDIYVYGGYDMNTGSPCNALYCFNIKTRIWREVDCTNPPAGRYGHSLNIWIRQRGKKTTPFLVVFGGKVEKDEFSNEIVLFNISKFNFKC